jgi:trimethylamine---corrinoid protein Co-methyltransferase
MGNHDTAERIHHASLELLDDPGVRVEHDLIVDLLLRSGGRPGAENHVVRFPPELVAECLQRCPAQVKLCDRSGDAVTLQADGAPSFWSCPGLNLHQRGEHRPFTSADMAGTARLLDRLDNVDVVFGMAMEDVPPHARDVVGLEIMARECGKHVRVLCSTPAGAACLIEMQQVVGPYPWLSVGFTAHGPLRWTHLALEIFRCTAGHGLPVTVNGEPMAGASGPVSLAGTAAVGNAEILAGIVINQLLEPGRPCIANLGLAHTMDMRTAIAVTGGPENALLAAVGAQLGRYYNLPSASWVSTEAMLPDAQAAQEKMFGFQTHVASGVSAVWGVGQLESELTFSPAQAVIDDEMISYARRYWRGVDTDADSLAVDVIRRVGVAGSFLQDEHTLERFREELFAPRLLWRDRRANWTQDGCRDLTERAEERADALMAQPRGPVLTPEQTRELDRLAQRLVRQD